MDVRVDSPRKEEFSPGVNHIPPFQRVPEGGDSLPLNSYISVEDIFRGDNGPPFDHEIVHRDIPPKKAEQAGL